MDADEVHTVLDALAAAGCDAWISGGWGVDVGCVSVEQQLLFHSGYEPRDVDRADLAVLHSLARA